MTTKLNVTDFKMLQVVDHILQLGKERFKKDICEHIGIHAQTLRNIREGKQHFTAENIRMMVMEYNVNLNYIFGLEDNVFMKKKVNKKVNKEYKNHLNIA